MAHLTVSIEGFDEIEKKLDSIIASLPRGIGCALDTSISNLQALATSILDAQTKGVGLPRKEQSINENWLPKMVERHGDVYSKELYNTSSHAQAVEYGTIGPIYPTHGLWLKYTLADGTEIQTLSVKGQAPKSFLTKARDMSRKPFIDNLTEELLRCMKEA